MSLQKSSFSTEEAAFHQAIIATSAKAKRSQWISAALLVSLAVVATFWLMLSVRQARLVQEQNREIQAKTDQLQKQSTDLGVKIVSETAALAALEGQLKTYGWSGDKVAMLQKVIQQSIDADTQLNKVRTQSPTQNLKKAPIVVQYFPKDVDGDKVRDALAGLGFAVEIKDPLVADVAANEVAFGDNVSAEQAKAVAYVLIRAGVEIRGIYKSRMTSKANDIQVIANRLITQDPPLTVEQIRARSTFAESPL